MRHVLAPLLSACLALPSAFTPSTANAHIAPLAMRHAHTEGAASVLGLRSEDETAGTALTSSLRTAFAQRGMSGGEELTLEEVVLTLGCSSEADTNCMTEAGRALSVDQLVYGTLEESDDAFVLKISVLDVGTGQIEAQASMPLSTEALSADSVDSTAADVVSSLYPGEDDELPIGAPPVVADEGGEQTKTQPFADPPRDSDLVWGPYRPRPRWKTVGLGISAGLFGASLVTAVVAGSLGEFVYSGEADTAQTASLEDDDPDNDILPGRDYCDRALAGTNNDQGERVVMNVEVAKRCRTVNTAFTVQWVGVGVAIASGLSTIAFAVLYNVHKRSTATSDARRKRRFRLTGGPTRSGVMLGGTGRF